MGPNALPGASTVPQEQKKFQPTENDLAFLSTDPFGFIEMHDNSDGADSSAEGSCTADTILQEDDDGNNVFHYTAKNVEQLVACQNLQDRFAKLFELVEIYERMDYVFKKNKEGISPFALFCADSCPIELFKAFINTIDTVQLENQLFQTEQNILALISLFSDYARVQVVEERIGFLSLQQVFLKWVSYVYQNKNYIFHKDPKKIIPYLEHHYVDPFSLVTLCNDENNNSLMHKTVQMDVSIASEILRLVFSERSYEDRKQLIELQNYHQETVFQIAKSKELKERLRWWGMEAEIVDHISDAIMRIDQQQFFETLQNVQQEDYYSLLTTPDLSGMSLLLNALICFTKPHVHDDKNNREKQQFFFKLLDLLPKDTILTMRDFVDDSGEYRYQVFGGILNIYFNLADYSALCRFDSNGRKEMLDRFIELNAEAAVNYLLKQYGADLGFLRALIQTKNPLIALLKRQPPQAAGVKEKPKSAYKKLMDQLTNKERFEKTKTSTCKKVKS